MTTGQWNVRWLSLAALVVLCLCAPAHSQQAPNELAAINDPARLGSALGLLGFVEPASTS